ncbi:MAG: tripartite tricarboxylate transporter permease [Deltaproteobacteria bacterium]
MIDILNSSLSGLYQIFTWATFSLMLLGMLIGFTVGILPGLGGATTLALMLPFIFKMSAFEAFAFLLGMAAVTNTTGDITSILFGVPGEPTTAATIVDGYPMTKKGEAGRALGAALLSSWVSPSPAPSVRSYSLNLHRGKSGRSPLFSRPRFGCLSMDCSTGYFMSPFLLARPCSGLGFLLSNTGGVR